MVMANKQTPKKSWEPDSEALHTPFSDCITVSQQQTIKKKKGKERRWRYLLATQAAALIKFIKNLASFLPAGLGPCLLQARASFARRAA